MALDPSTFNWAALLLVISTLLIAAWLAAAWRASAKTSALFVSFAFLITACKSSAAPFRGLVDPDYVGFGFGLLQAGQGWPVTIAAGSVVLFGAAAAFLALRPREPRSALFAGAVGLAFLILQLPVFLPLLVSRPGAIVMQFGEYLTVPPAAAIPIGLYMVAGYTAAVAIAARALLRQIAQRELRASA